MTEISMQPSIVGLIPARSGSKGIPGKNIKPLCGEPLIARTIKTALSCDLLERVVVTTDSEDIAAISREYGALVPFLRPKELATDTSPSTGFIEHALDFFASQGKSPDIIVLLQPTSPLRSMEDIQGCIDLLVKSGADSVVSVSPVELKHHPQWQFTVGSGSELESYSGGFSEIPTRRQDLRPTYTRNGAIYAFWANTYAAHGNIYGTNVMAWPMPEERSVNIDEPADWDRAEALCAGDKGVENG